MQEQQIEITIINWGKYNPKDMQVNTPYWFRMENTINRSESLFGLSKTDRWHWVCLLAVASKKKSGKFVCDLRWLCVELALRRRQIVHVLDTFLRQKLLTFELKTVKKQEVELPVNYPATIQYNTEQYIVVEKTEEGTTTTQKSIFKDLLVKKNKDWVIQELDDFPEEDASMLKLLTKHGQKTYLKRFGDKFLFHKELKNCYLLWESKPEPKQPFVTALNNWYQRWLKAKEE